MKDRRILWVSMTFTLLKIYCVLNLYFNSILWNKCIIIEKKNPVCSIVTIYNSVRYFMYKNYQYKIYLYHIDKWTLMEKKYWPFLFILNWNLITIMDYILTIVDKYTIFKKKYVNHNRKYKPTYPYIKSYTATPIFLNCSYSRKNTSIYKTWLVMFKTR